jgi:hypothetical protein
MYACVCAGKESIDSNDSLAQLQSASYPSSKYVPSSVHGAEMHGWRGGLDVGALGRRTDRARGGYCVLAGGEGSGRRWWGGARVRWRRRLGHRRDEFDWGFVEDKGKERGQGPAKRYFSLRGGSLP